MTRISAILRDGQVYLRCPECRAELAVPSATWRHENKGDAFMRALRETGAGHQCVGEAP